MSLSNAIAEVLLFGEERDDVRRYPDSTVRMTIYTGDGLTVWTLAFDTEKERSNDHLQRDIATNRPREYFRDEAYGITSIYYLERQSSVVE